MQVIVYNDNSFSNLRFSLVAFTRTNEMTKADLIHQLGANKPNFAKNYLNPLRDAGFISYTKAKVKLLKVETEVHDFEV